MHNKNRGFMLFIRNLYKFKGNTNEKQICK